MDRLKDPERARRLARVLVSDIVAYAGDEVRIGLEKDDLFDKMRGMWIGELIGNTAGRETEGDYDGAEPNPNPSVPWRIKRIWDGDDDTDGGDDDDDDGCQCSTQSIWGAPTAAGCLGLALWLTRRRRVLAR